MACDGNANGETTSSYDPWQHLVSTTNPVSRTTLYTYTATEQVAVRDPQGNVTASQYDPAGRLTLTTDPSHNTTQEQYDAVGNTVAITGGTALAATTVETRSYDARNEVATDTTSGPGLVTPLTTRTYYDGDGNVAQVQQPTGDVTYNTYTFADEVRTVEVAPAPVGKGGAPGQPRVDSYTYDATGNQVTHFDPDNRTDTTTPDAANRTVLDVATVPGPGGTAASGTVITTTTSFDPDGNTVSWTRQTQTQAGPVQTQTDSATYDAADRQTSSTDNGLTTAYGYDAAGQQRTHTIADGATTVTTTLDPQGRQTGLSEGLGGAGPYASSLGYNANDLPITMTLPGGSGVQEAMGYDASSRLTSLTLAGPASSPATTTLSSAYAYGYNPLNWTTRTTTLSGTDTLVHDAQGRLTSESGPQVVATGGAYKWTYDPNGNLLSQIGDNGYPVTYTYTSAITPNQLQTMVMGDGQPTTFYGYDGHGDTTAITNGLGAVNPAPKNALNTHMTYDSQARPVQITFLDRVAPSTTTVTATVTLAYNPAGQRSEYTLAEPGQATLDEQFTYRSGMLGQLRVTKGGTLLYTDTYLYSQSGAPYELLRTNGSGATSRYWYELDGRGNVVALTDINGKVVDRYAYDSWGELTSNDATDETVPQQLRYAGYWYDEKLSWYWLSVRYYDPEIERFLQPDPSEQDGVRTYAYVGDDPIDLTDPSGLSSPAPTPTTTPGTKTPAPVPSSQIGPCGQHGPQLAYCHAPANSQNWVVVARCLDQYAPYSSAYVAASGGQPICGATWPGLGTVTEDLPPSGYIDPFLVRFTQDTGSWVFRNKQTREIIGTVGELVNALRNGTVKPTDIPPINVVLRNGDLWSLDNRRLEAFRRAGVPIRYRLVDWSPDVEKEWGRKFSTENNGESIRLKGEPEPPADPGQLVDPIEPIEPIEPIM